MLLRGNLGIDLEVGSCCEYGAYHRCRPVLCRRAGRWDVAGYAESPEESVVVVGMGKGSAKKSRGESARRRSD